MKKALFLLAVLLGLVAIAVAGIDFSGTWAFDAAKSDQPAARAGGGGGGGGGGMGRGGGGDIVIKQTGNELTITRTFGQNSFETKYTMDGAEHTSTSQMGDLKYKAVLSGDTLTITGTRTTQRGDQPVNEAYTLSADGKALTIATTRGERTTKQVYNKK